MANTKRKIILIAINLHLAPVNKETKYDIFFSSDKILNSSAKKNNLEIVSLKTNAVLNSIGYKNQLSIPNYNQETLLNLKNFGYLWHLSSSLSMDILHQVKELEGTIEPSSCSFLFQNAGPLHIACAIRVSLALKGQYRFILDLHQMHRYYRSANNSSYPQLRWFFNHTRKIRKRANVYLYANSDRLATCMERDLGEGFPVLPRFSSSEQVNHYQQKIKNGSKFRIFCPSRSIRHSQGFDLICELAKRLQNLDVEIVLLEPSNRPYCELNIGLRAKAAGIIVKDEPYLEGADYGSLLESMDLIILPFRKKMYASRPSRLFVDAVTYCVPVVGTDDTWIGDQIKELACGTVFSDGNIDDFEENVRFAMENISTYQGNLDKSRLAWLEINNANSYLQKINEKFVVPTHSRTGLHSIACKLSELWFNNLVDNILPVKQKYFDPVVLDGRAIIRSVLRQPRGYLKAGHLPLTFRSKFLSWHTYGIGSIEIRADSMDGMLICRGGPAGTIQAYNEVITPRFYVLLGFPIRKPGIGPILLDKRLLGVSPYSTIGWYAYCKKRQVSRYLQKKQRFIRRKSTGSMHFELDNSQYRLDNAIAVISWQSRKTEQVQIRLNSPNGTLFAASDTNGHMETGCWLDQSPSFYLQDVSRGKTLSRDNTLDSFDANMYLTTSHQYCISQYERNLEQCVSKGLKEAEDNFRNRFARNNAQEKKLHPDSVLEIDDWGIIPVYTTGEVLVTCMAAQAILKKYGGKRIILFMPKHFHSICELFQGAPIISIDSRSYEIKSSEINSRSAEIGKTFTWSHLKNIVDVSEPHQYYETAVPFTRMYLDFLDLQIDFSKIPVSLPRRTIESAKRHFGALNLMEGRSVVIAPSAYSKYPTPTVIWEKFAKKLIALGWNVCTNVGPGEAAIAGTQALRCSFSELVYICELAGHAYVERSGLCELLSVADMNFHILQLDYTTEVFPGVQLLFGLGENGFTDKAHYHYFKEGHSVDDYINQLISSGGMDLISPADESKLQTDLMQGACSRKISSDSTK